MNKPFPLLLLFLLVFGLLSACSDSQRPAAPVEASAPPRTADRSRVRSFRRRVVMDDIRVVLEGQVVGGCTQCPVPATVQLLRGTAKYRAIAAPNGTFCFGLLPAGTYVLTATHPAYLPLRPSSVELGSGDVSQAILSLGCKPTSPRRPCLVEQDSSEGAETLPGSGCYSESHSVAH